MYYEKWFETLIHNYEVFFFGYKVSNFMAKTIKGQNDLVLCVINSNHTTKIQAVDGHKP